MKTRYLFPLALTVGAVTAQNVAIFPSEYSAVPEGPFNSPNTPLSYGTSRMLLAYNRLDLNIPAGSSIQRLGFRQDGGSTALVPGRGLQLEVRMGYTTNPDNALNFNFDANYVGTPVTVFGPALFTLPNLHDPASPLVNDRFFINLTTSFPYNPGTNNLLVEYRILGTSGGGSAFNYPLDRADYYSPIVNGPPGCTHSSGGPATLTVLPVAIGGNYTSNLAAAPTNAFSLLVMSVGGPLVTPFGLGQYVSGISPTCLGQVPVAGAMALPRLTNNGGSAVFSFQVPTNALLHNLQLSGQCATFDFFAPGGIVVSNGAQVQIGIPPRCGLIYAQGPPATTPNGSGAANYCPVAFFGYQ